MDADLEQALLKIAPIAFDTAVQLAPMFIKLINLSPNDRQQAIADLMQTLEATTQTEDNALADMDATDVKVKQLIDEIPTKDLNPK